MDLQLVKDKKDAAADYIGEQITRVCADCGKRSAGDFGEEEAINYVAAELGKYADTVKTEAFDLHPAAFMGWIYISVSLFLIALLCFFFLPLLSVILIIAGMVLMLCEFILYRQTVDKLFKRKTSHNITAIKHPMGEVKRRLVFSGHIDAAAEWTFNYQYGGVGFIGHFLISVLGLVYLFVISIIALIKPDLAALKLLGYIALVFLPFWLAMYMLWNERVIADGANDDLSGTFMGVSVLKMLKDNGVELQNTELGVIICGAEEAGLRGSKAWSKTHKGEFDDVPTLIIAFDTIREGAFLGVNYKDLNSMVSASSEAVDLFYNAANKCGINIQKCTVPLGATDSAAFNQAGFKAVAVTAMNHVLPRYYHTRLDTSDNIDKKTLADCFEATLQAIEDFDDGADSEE